MSVLADARLYGIIDLGYCKVEDTEKITSQMIEGGVDIVQLRAKNMPTEQLVALAKKLSPIFVAANIPFILNDYPALALSTGASGAHVGQDDLSISEARRLAGQNCIIGKSTHSCEQAIAAGKEADYIGFGPLFSTPTKPDYTPIGLDDIRRVHEEVAVPIFCIGGIKLENLPQIIEAGATRVVIVSGLLKASNLVSYAQQAKKLLLG